jgi:methyl-accepting chemotaxis protein
VSLQAKDAFERIVASVVKTSDSIRRIADTTEQQQATSRLVAEQIRSLGTSTAQA